jgi:peptidoglycan/xylan/chitin deacetylase (PgdA/CDA1 family)
MDMTATVNMLLRDDDIFLTESPSNGRHLYNFEKFVKVHTMLQSYQKKHAIAIIASEIDNYPKLKEYIKANKKDFIFGVHGWGHQTYSVWGLNEIKESLGRAMGKIDDVFGVRPEYFFPPWNKRSPAIFEACGQLKLKVDEFFTNAVSVLQGDKADTLCFHYWNDLEVKQLEECLKKGLV